MTEPEQPTPASNPDSDASAVPELATGSSLQPAEPVAVPDPGTAGVPETAPATWPAAQESAPGAPQAWPATADPATWPVAAAAAPVAAVGPTTSSNAIISLILAIVSWAVCPIAPAIVALVFASMATKEIDAAGGRIEGRGLVTASRIVSWINIGFWAAVILVGLFVLLIVLIAGGAANLRD